jgi:glucose-1-phosphate adenylyltransferase
MNSVGYCVLAGGLGSRLRPLTDRLPKPLIRFGSDGRIIDFTLYNCLASGGGDCLVLTQYLSHLIECYLGDAWREAFAVQGRRLLVASPPERGGFLGTADAVFKSLGRYRRLPDYLVILAGDHVYRMDYRGMIDFHQAHGGWATVGAVQCLRGQANRFGIIETGAGGQILRFHEKPRSLDGIAPARARPLASMGIYVFTARALMDFLREYRDEGVCDFGGDVMPRMAAGGKAFAYRFQGARGAMGYWRDIGELPAYWKASMELLNGAGRKLRFEPLPGLGHLPFSRDQIVRGGEKEPRRVFNSLLSGSARVESGALVDTSVVGPGARIEAGAVVRRSVIMEGAVVHRRARLEDAVVEPEAEVPADTPPSPETFSAGVHFLFRRRKPVAA